MPPRQHRAPRPRLVTVLLLLGAVAWGSTYLCAKSLLPDAAYAPVLVASRMLISATVLALFATFVRRRRPTASEVRSGILFGLPLSAVFALENYGIALTSVTNAGVLISLCIVLVPFAETAVRRTRVNPVLVLLCIVAVIGAVLLVSGAGFSAPGLGDLLILGAALARVVHVTTSSAVQDRHPTDPFWVTAIQLATVGVVFVIVCVVIGAPVGAFIAGLTGPAIVALLYLSVVAGAFVFAIQTWGIAVTSAAHASLLLGTEPVWAALFGIILAGDRLDPLGAVGIVLTLSAVLAAQRVSASAPRIAREVGVRS
ncbi:DMT family transporter [Microbacterium sp. VKM Ac-2870]|uniref:DMT family transporter n=1 Tax=Microbacterium sp. VKM Ac-2870 TaxID=2783825 RepID=UPI00188C8CB4|nr:DMT family transporter [Microbacterium sp. VKM Ac-2870]MBF4562470.1 DMT family transporter [Microbacterium sp. VKM Ac-2870]